MEERKVESGLRERERNRSASRLLICAAVPGWVFLFCCRA